LGSARIARAENGRVRFAVLGLSRGQSLAQTLAGFEDCDLRMVCDLDPRRLEAAHAELPNADRIKAVTHHDAVLEDPEVDAVIIATPDHWHAPLSLMALQAGKHVYVEKPCSHNVHESAALVRAAETTGLCVQHGTQSRSGGGIQAAFAYLEEGHLGKIRLAKAINHQLRNPIGRAPVEEPPAGVDYDLWTGPAPLRPFTQNRWHYNWHWLWDFGGGDIVNDGIHQLDVARWGLGVGYPREITAPGGQLFYDDDHETPDTQMVTYQYDDVFLVYEMRLWTNYALEGHDNGVIFYGDKGRLDVGRRGSIVYPLEGDPRRLGGSGDLPAHLRNFVDCIKTNNPAGLNAPMREAAISSDLCHLANIATRVGRPVRFDPENLVCTGDDEATALLRRSYRTGYELPEIA